MLRRINKVLYLGSVYLLGLGNLRIAIYRRELAGQRLMLAEDLSKPC
jgi:hypothetical protein